MKRCYYWKAEPDFDQCFFVSQLFNLNDNLLFLSFEIIEENKTSERDKENK